MFNEGLSKKENEVMSAVFALSSGKERFLVLPYEILSVLPVKGRYDEEGLDRLLRALELDGYFDLISTDRKGERAYVVHMRQAGLSFQRNDKRRKRGLLFRVALTLFCAVLSALVGIIIKGILS